MKTNMKFGIGVILTAMLLVSMAFVPAASASTDTSKEQQMPKELKQWLKETHKDEETKLWMKEQTEQWMQNHTLKVTSTKTYKYTNGQLEIKETYTGKELNEKFKIDEFEKVEKFNATENAGKALSLNGESFDLTDGNERVVVAEKTVVMTTQTDPFEWWSIGYEYPQYTWHENNSAYERADPINLAWENTYEITVKGRILDRAWVDPVLEETQYVSDPDPQIGWEEGDGLATSIDRTLGGYHVRLFNLSTQDIVGGAHRDSSYPHVVTELETAENLVAGFFDNDLSNWWVLYDNEGLDNEEGDVQNEVEPFCDGEATVMWRVGTRS